MKYKLLLTGTNQQVIDIFFFGRDREFDCLTTSAREADVINHFNYFEPNGVVYCIDSESKADMMKFITTLKQTGRKDMKLVVIGEDKACNDFTQLSGDMNSITLQMPIAAEMAKKRVWTYLDNGSVDETPKKNILVIDDDPMMLRLIKSELKDLYSVATAVNGKIALDFLRRKDVLPDLILLDYEMPDMDGAQVFERLRTNLNTSNIPIVFLTGVNDREKIKKVFALKPQGYLLKPIDCDKLIQTIKHIIG